MKELAENYRKFYTQIIESNAHYTDDDFMFDNFMRWYANLPDYSDGKGHSIDSDGHCNRGCC